MTHSFIDYSYISCNYLFAFDIDGTSCLSDGQWVPGLIEACALATKNSAGLAFVTGRTTAWSLHFLKKLKVPYYLGALNGAERTQFPSSKVLQAITVPGQIIEELLRRTTASAIIYTKSKIYFKSDRRNAFFQNHLERRRSTQQEEWVPYEKEQLPSVLAVRIFMFEADAHTFAQECASDEVSVTIMRDSFHSGVCIVQITGKDADKGHAATFFACGKPYIAFGDDHNDIALFRRADHSYAIEGAPKELIELADEVIDVKDIPKKMEEVIKRYGNRY